MQKYTHVKVVSYAEQMTVSKYLSLAETGSYSLHVRYSKRGEKIFSFKQSSIKTVSVGERHQRLKTVMKNSDAEDKAHRLKCNLEIAVLLRHPCFIIPFGNLGKLSF